MSAIPPSPIRPARPRWLLPAIIVAVLALVAVGTWYFLSRDDTAAGQVAAKDGKDAKDAKDGKGGKGRGGRFQGGGGGPQPVAAATARTGDINIVQTALGTVTALRTVTVRPRVDGMLKDVLFTEGQLVKANQPIALIDPVPFQVALAQAEGALARDAAQLNNARLDLERYQKLLAQDSIASQQVDQQAAQVRQFEGAVKVDQAQVDNAKLQLSYTSIVAPISGRLGLRQVDQGNMVRGSDTNGIAVITQVDPISVIFTIPQDTLPRVLARLQSGDKPPVEAWDREQKNLLGKGALVTTDNQIDVATGTVKLKAQFANAEGKLFPNQFVNVRMVVDVRRGVVLVPSAAINRGAQGTVVYVVKDDSTVTLRTVTTGATEGQDTQVESGLRAGERVVTDGVDRIREGAKVEVTQPGTRGGGGGGQGMEPAKREEMRKKMEGMTPEQKQEFMKKMREQRASGAATPTPAAAAPETAKVEPGRAPPAAPTPRPTTPVPGPSVQPSPTGAEAAAREEFRKSLEGMGPEERKEAIRKRLESMTPEQREAWKKQRAERGGAAPQ